MASTDRSFSIRSLIEIELELLPWVGLAAASTFLTVPGTQTVGEGSRLLLVLSFLIGGAVIVFARRQWESLAFWKTSEASSTDNPVRSPVRPRSPSSGDGVPSPSDLHTLDVPTPSLDDADAPQILSRPDLTILAVSDAFERVFGYSEPEVIGMTPGNAGLWEEPNVESHLRRHLTLKMIVEKDEVLVRTSDNRVRPVKLSVSAGPGQYGDYLTWTFRPKHADKAPSKPPCTEADRDSLTGLAGRSFLTQEITNLLEHDRHPDDGPALLSLTIDEYRDVAESFGHDAGQQLLTVAATRIEESIPPTATAARIAEDTFAVLLHGADVREAEHVGEALLDAINTPFDLAGHEIPIKVSLGIAVRPTERSDFNNAKEMLQASYSAMYQANRDGGGKVHVLENVDHRNGRWLHRRERLREAIQNEELTVHYQPVIHLVSGEPVGAEALVRWDHPERGLLSPAAFIPLAEETGLVGKIDRWVFEQALEQAERWTNDTDGPVDWVSVNISPQSVEEDLQTWCRTKLRNVSLPEGALHLEITERWALRDERSLQPLRDEGIRLSIDDFGTGYSSLRYLRSLEADLLKIDREFIEDLGNDPKTTAIVQFLLNLALKLDVKVIAEGVETARQEETLRNLGCAMAQGYHFAKPAPPNELEDSLGAHARNGHNESLRAA